MKMDDLLKPGAVGVAVVGAAAIGFVAGLTLARNPQLLRKLTRYGAAGFERMAASVAEAREELADLWAVGREGARAAIDEEQFAAAAASAAVAAAQQAANQPAPRPSAAARNRRTSRRPAGPQTPASKKRSRKATATEAPGQ